VQKGGHGVKGLILEPHDDFALIRVHVLFDYVVRVGESAVSGVYAVHVGFD
jgi:hypothetical protein